MVIRGKTPLLMHADSIEWADQIAAWRDDPANRGKQVKGDDRSPAFNWLGYTYNDGVNVCIPADNIAVCLREGGAMVPVPGGKAGKVMGYKVAG